MDHAACLWLYLSFTLFQLVLIACMGQFAALIQWHTIHTFLPTHPSLYIYVANIILMLMAHAEVEEAA